MLANLWWQYLRRLSPVRVRRTNKLHHGVGLRSSLSPRCEELEDRMMLSTFVVNNATDGHVDGLLSLREALAQANTDAAAGISDTIAFDSSLGGQEIDLTSGQLELSGAGAGTIAIDGSTPSSPVKLSAAFFNRLFQVDSGVQAVISNVGLANGRAQDDDGGLIWNHGTLTLKNASLSSGNATNDGLGGPGGFGGAIENQGTMTVNNVMFESNQSQTGGAIHNVGTLNVNASTFDFNFGAFGGAIASEGTLTINDSVFTNNSANSSGGAIDNSFTGTMTIHGSFFSSNSADFGGVIENFSATATLDRVSFISNSASTAGGAIDNASSTLTITNSTFDTNSADFGGTINSNNSSTLAISNSTITNSFSRTIGGGIQNAGNSTLTLVNTTLVNNRSSGSGGAVENASGTATISSSTIYNNIANSNGGGIDNFGTLSLENTIVSSNFGFAGGNDINGAITTDKGHNLLGAGANNVTNDPVPGPGNVFSDAPGLADLGDYGGPTATLALTPGSPAIAAGNAAAALPTTDQRARPRVVNGHLDIGAFQTQATALVFTSLGETFDAGDSATIGLQLLDANGLPLAAGAGGVSVTLSSNSLDGVFLDSAGVALPGSTIVIPAGANSISFRYSDDQAGTPTITVSAAGSATITQQELVLPAPVSETPSPAIVVGRVLSSYTTADIQNHQETITYTVYNEQGHVLSDVLLTDTLAAGETIVSASLQPNQNGQNLSWSLGAIPAYGRVTVQVTLSLPNSPALQLDTGAVATATLDAGTVSDRTTPATLRAGSINPTLLASTPDANTNDPFVQEVAAALDYNPQNIFNYLHQEIGYESYRGSMRGARGTMWSGAGNALDVASLGVALMRASGIPAEYVGGDLSYLNSQQLILSMFPDNFQTAGYAAPGAVIADPSNDFTLQNETQDHYWFRFDTGTGWTDADPLLPDAHIGQSFTNAKEVFSEVPDDQRQKTEVKLTAEIYLQVSAAFGLGNGLTQTVVLDQTFNDVDLVGHPLSIGNFVKVDGFGALVFSSQTTTYSPYIAIGDVASDDVRDNLLIRGTDYQETATNFPLGNCLLTGLFLDVSTSGPQSSETYQKALVDRIGYAARQGFSPVQVSVDPTAPPLISSFDVFTLEVDSGLGDPNFPALFTSQIANLREQADQLFNVHDSIPTQLSSLLSQTAIVETTLLGAAVTAASDGISSRLASDMLVKAYADQPRLTVVSHRLTLNSQTHTYDETFTVDLVRDTLRALSFPGQADGNDRAFGAIRGIAENKVETAIPALIFSDSETATVSPTAINVVKAAVQQGIQLTLINGNNLITLDTLSLSPEAKARITAAVQDGRSVIVPSSPVDMNGTPSIAWYEIDPQTGESIGVTEDGGHEGIFGLAATRGIAAALIVVLLAEAFAPFVDPGEHSPHNPHTPEEDTNPDDFLREKGLVEELDRAYGREVIELVAFSPAPIQIAINNLVAAGATTAESSGLNELGSQFASLLQQVIHTPLPGAPSVNGVVNPVSTAPFAVNNPFENIPITATSDTGAVTGNVQTPSLTVSTASTSPIATAQIPSAPNTVAFHGNLAYVAGSTGIDIVDVSNPTAPQNQGTFGTDKLVPGSGNIVRFDHIGGTDYLLVATTSSVNAGAFNLLVYALSNPLHPQFVSSTTFNYNFPSNMLVQGNTVLIPTDGYNVDASANITDQFGTLLSINVSNPAAPTFADVLFNNRGTPKGGDTNISSGVIVNGQVAYFAGTTSTGAQTQSGNGQVHVVDYSNPANLSVTHDLNIPGTVQVLDIAIQGHFALVVGSTQGWLTPISGGVNGTLGGQMTLSLLDITNPQNPQLVGTTLVTNGEFLGGSVIGTAASLGDGKFAVNGTEVDGQPVVWVVDPAGQGGLVANPVRTTRLTYEAAVNQDKLFLTSGDGLAVYDIPDLEAASQSKLDATWQSTATNSYQAGSVAATNATVTDGNGNVVGTGAIALSVAVPIATAVSGNVSYHVQGIGSLSFYGTTGTVLGVSGDWQNYTATTNAVSGKVTIVLTTDSLTLNGQPLPAGTYTITAPAATLAGQGATAAPSFTGTVSFTAKNDVIQVGGTSDHLNVDGNPIDLSSGVTMSGYSGTIGASASTPGMNAVTFNGNMTDVVSVSASSASQTTNQNTPITFTTVVHSSVTDTFHTSAEAPAGWTVVMDANGVVTATPAPGLQAGVYPIRLVTRSLTHPDLVAQSTVNVTITPTQPAITLTVAPDAEFTVPFQGGQLPTAFRAEIHNSGPTADTFNLTFPNLPAGFTVLSSLTSITIPAGETGIVGIYVVPNAGTVPAPGTQITFTLTATSTSHPAVTATQTESFTMPTVDAVTLSVDPTTVTTVPGNGVTATITLTNAGNVNENVTLADGALAGLTITGFTPVTLTPGQSATQTVTLTPAADATLIGTIIATFGPGAAPLHQSVNIPVQVTVPGAQALASAALAAQRIGNTDLANQFNNLTVALTNLVQDPTNAIYLSQAEASLASLVTLVTTDPFLAPFTSVLTDAETALANATTSQQIDQAIIDLGNGLQTLSQVLIDEVAHRFTLGLQQQFGIVQPGVPTVFNITMQNTGSATTTYDFSVTGLGAGVTATFSSPSITLDPNDFIPNGQHTITLSLTETGDTLFPASFTVHATAEGAPAITLSTDGQLKVRDEALQVGRVVVDPPFTNAGGQVHVTAKIQSIVNEPTEVSVSYIVLDAAGNTVFTSPAPVTANLTINSVLTDVDLGNLNTTGFADGLHKIVVTVTDTSGQPLPTATGQGSLMIGLPVNGSLSVSPVIVPSGTTTVTNTLEVSATVDLPDPLVLLDEVATTPTANTVALYQNGAQTLAYVSGNNGIDVVDVSDPTNLVNVNTFGTADIVTGGFTVGRIDTIGGTDYLLVGTTLTRNANQFTLLVYSLADPEHPALFSTNVIPYQFLAEMLVQGDTLIVPTDGVFISFFGSIFDQFGSVLSVNVSDPAHAVLSDTLFDTRPAPNGGDTRQFGGILVNDHIAYIASSTSVGGDISQGEGRVLVVDYSDPTNLQVVGTLLIPGTVYLNDITIQGNQALVVGTNGTADLDGVQGNMVLAVLDISTPESPQLSGQSITTPNTFGTGKISALPLGNGIYAVSDALLNNNPVLLLVDPSNPSLPIVTDTPLTSIINEMAVSGGILYASGPNGIATYQIGQLVDIPVTESVRIPNNTGVTVVPGSFSIPPTQIIPGVDFDTYVWNLDLAFGNSTATITWQTTLSDVDVDEVRTVATGGTVDFVSQGTPGTFDLNPTSVTGTSIVSLTPTSQTAQPGATVNYVIRLTNPTDAPVQYFVSAEEDDNQFVLSSVIVNSFNSFIQVPANGTVDVPLEIASFSDADAGDVTFKVSVSSNIFGPSAEGSVEGTLTLAGNPAPRPVVADGTSHGVVVGLTPSQATAGQGTDASFVARVTNTGSREESYFVQVEGLPNTIFAEFDNNVDQNVPPGISNFHDFPFRLTVQAGTAPGTYPFSVVVSANSDDSISDTVTGTLTVLPNGVTVNLSPFEGPAGTTYQMTVTNNGTVADTYSLTLGGPAALVANLGSDQVTLAPGQSKTIPVTTGPIDIAQPGELPLVAIATSQTNSAIKNSSTANIVIPNTKGVGASFTPAAKVLAQPGNSLFVLFVDNTGNGEDSYTATITGTNGPVTATLTGLDGNPTQTIPIFTLPGLSRGALMLNTNLTAVGAGQVFIQIHSLTTGDVVATATATVSTGLAVPVVTVTGGTFDFDNQAHAASGTVTGTNNEDLGAPTITYTDANNVTTTTPPTNAGTYTVTASFAGNDTYGAASNTTTLTINRITPTLAVNGGTFTYDAQSHAATGSVTGLNNSNLGTPTFSYEDSNHVISATPPVNGGTYTVTASFAGNTNYNPASSIATIVIQPVTPVVVISGGTFNFDGQPHPATGSVRGVNNVIIGVPTITYEDANHVVSDTPPVSVGVYTVTASFAGDANYNATSSTATITIQPVGSNLPPTDISLSNNTLVENQPAGTVVGTFSSTDPDAGNTFTYSLVTGDGSDDNASFTLTPAGQLATAGAFDFETQNTFTIRVRTTDQGGLSFEKEFTINVSNADEPPEIVLAPGVRILPVHSKKQAFDPTAFIRDVDTPVINLANATVQVDVIENRGKTDKVRLLKSKHGDLVIKGKHIFYQGTLIGERVYGKKGAVPLTIHFNGPATQPGVEATLDKIYYRTKGTAGATRKLEYSLQNLTNGQSSKTDKDVLLQ